jgi:DNA repair exonuclease SbcCD nuclease subunit
MKVDELNIASISDIHLGHRNNDTPFIVKNLYVAFPDTAETWALDIIFIAGDLFDRLLTYPDGDLPVVEDFLVYLMRMCAYRDIKLRVLEGTKSHDWRQSSIFLRLASALKLEGLDLQYFTEPTVEYIEAFGIHVLYIPDEWDEDTNRTLAYAKELMRLRGIDQVDFAIMHGQFEYQLPEVVKAPKHDAEAYLALVKYLIFIGHVHTFSNYKRIYAHGSFDRLTQGEEGPKGHLRARVRSEQDYTVTFVENKGARIFRTFECFGLTLEETLAEIEYRVEGIPDGSFIRISVDKGNPILTEMQQLQRIAPLIHWSKKVRDSDDEVIRSENPFDEQTFVPVEITKENVWTLLEARLRQRGISDAVLEMAQLTITDMR